MASPLGRVFRRSSSSLPSYVVDTSKERSPAGRVIHLVTTVGAAFCAGSLMRHYFLTWDPSEGESMTPTIPSANSVSITSPMYRHGKGIKIGDIVHAQHPLQAQGRVGKRVIGMPGDYVLRDESLEPTAGGSPVPGIYTKQRREPVMIQVPEGHVWLAGDNMSRSRDSRFYGPVPLAMIESRVLYNVEGVSDWSSFRGEQLKSTRELREIEEVD